MNSYIEKQLKMVDFIGDYLPKIKISNNKNTTNWLDIDNHTLIQIINLLKVSQK